MNQAPEPDPERMVAEVPEQALYQWPGSGGDWGGAAPGRRQGPGDEPGEPGPEHALDLVSHAVFLIDPLHNRIVEANRAACEMLGYQRDELLATPMSAIHPAELPQLAAWVSQVRRDQLGWSGLFNCRTKAGTYLPVEMMALAPDPDGLVVVFVQDRSTHRGPATP